MTERPMTLAELSSAVGGILKGNPRLVVRRPAPADTAGPEEIALFRKPATQEALMLLRAGVVVLPKGSPDVGEKNLIYVNDGDLAFIEVLRLFAGEDDFPLMEGEGVSSRAQVAVTAHVASSASVGAESVVGEGTVLAAGVQVGRRVRIGSDCRLYPHVVVHDGTVLGDRVTIKSGSVIGGRGFGYHRSGDRHIPIPQIGSVIIGDDADIGSCVCVDRATLGATIIGRGVKIDNLVQIAHNVTIGDRTIIISQTGISGSVTIGADAILAGQAGIADHVVIEDGAVVGAKSGVLARVKTGQMVLGIPARPIMQFKRSVVMTDRLGELFKRVDALEKKTSEEPHG